MGVNPKRLLARIAGGNLLNVSVRDFSALVAAFEIREARIEGSRHIFLHVRVSDRVRRCERICD